MRDEFLDGELFLHIDETKYVVERWRMDYAPGFLIQRRKAFPVRVRALLLALV